MLPFIIDTSDKRCLYLQHSLKEKGYDARERGTTYERCVLILPPAKVITTEEAGTVKEGSIIFGGRAEENAREMMRNRKISYVNLLEREEFLVQNTIPTALGCIALMLETFDVCINELKILVLGYGRVAKTLVKYLSGLDCKATVFTPNKEERALARLFASGVCDRIEDSWDLIINTIPAPIIKEDMKITCPIIDLASGGYVKGDKVIKAPSLPAKIAPRSAGRYMEECILEYLGKEGEQ